MVRAVIAYGASLSAQNWAMLLVILRAMVGVLIWASNVYVVAQMPVNELCSNMAWPNVVDPDRNTLKCVRFVVMHLLAHLDTAGSNYGGHGTFGLERGADVDISNPYKGKRMMFFHYFADANLTTRSRTGGVGMMAGGPLLAISQRQHLAAPDSHTAEVVGAGTNLNLIIPVNGTLQELGIRQGAPTPFYLDSATTVFVASSDTSIKKSVWLIRRAATLQDGVRLQEIEPLYLTERDMLADPFTKYLAAGVWARHVHYLQNGLTAVPA